MMLPLHCAEDPKENEQRNTKILTMYPQVQGLTECTLVLGDIGKVPGGHAVGTGYLCY